MGKREKVKKEKEKLTKEKIKKRIPLTVLISLCIPMILCFAVPFEVFGTNSEEFMFSLSDFLPILMAYGLVLFLIAFFSLLFLPAQAYRVGIAIYLALSLLLFLQGNYMNAGLSSLGGDNLGSAGIPVWLIAFNTVLWIVIIGLFVGLSFIKDKKGISKYVSFVLVAVVLATQIINPVATAVSNSGMFANKVLEFDPNSSKVLTTEGLTTVSSGRNVFVFVIDRFDEGYAELAMEEKPEIFSELEGFEMYDDNISQYGHTYPGIANLLTRRKIDMGEGERRTKFLEEVYADDGTMSYLAKNGYRCQVYTQAYYAYTDAYYLPDYVYNRTDIISAKVKNRGMLSMTMLGVSAYRCLPLITKNWLGGSLSSDVFHEFVERTGRDGYGEYSSVNSDVEEIVECAEFDTCDQNLFTFLHIEGCHSVINDYLNDPEGVSSSQRKKTVSKLEECFKIINTYIKVMKEKGVYNDATIIITGDHGAALSDINELGGASCTAMLVKRSGKGVGDGVMVRNSAPVSHDNMWPSILQSEGITAPEGYGKSFFDMREGDSTKREYVWHTYLKWCDEYVYSIDGSARNFDNWTLSQKNNYSYGLMD